MHLFDGLLFQLDSAEGKALRVADFVEQSQLLLQICSSDIGCPGDDSEMEGNRKGQGEEEFPLPESAYSFHFLQPCLICFRPVAQRAMKSAHGGPIC